MSLYLIIDGYNVINKIPYLVNAQNLSMESARDKLFKTFQEYCDFSLVEGLIVYDGNQSARTVEDGNPAVIFSKSNECADTIIESLIYNMENKQDARVVTDDRVITNLVTGMGAFTMSVNLFEQELEKIKRAAPHKRHFVLNRQKRWRNFLDL